MDIAEDFEELDEPEIDWQPAPMEGDWDDTHMWEPLVDAAEAFLPAKKFGGCKTGYAFRLGEAGLGYYWDDSTCSHLHDCNGTGASGHTSSHPPY